MRLFAALWPGPAARLRIAAARDACTWPAAARPVPTPALHLTLHFLGEVADERVPAFAAGLALPAVEPFVLRFGRFDLWPGGVAVLRPLHEPPTLAALHAALGERLYALGHAGEARAFRAHVTLARGAAGTPLPPAPAAWAWRVRGYALMRSLPQRGYAMLRSYP